MGRLDAAVVEGGATEIIASSRNLGSLLRRLIDHLDTAVEQSYRQAGLDYRPRFTPIVRALRGLGPSSREDLAYHLGISYETLALTLDEMVWRDLVKLGIHTDNPVHQIVSMSPRLIEMMPTIQRCWDATEKASATLNEELGHDLPELLGRTIGLLERRSLHVRLLEARLRLQPVED